MLRFKFATYNFIIEQYLHDCLNSQNICSGVRQKVNIPECVHCFKIAILYFYLFQLSFSMCFVCVSVCVRWRARHSTREAAVCNALPVRCPPVSVPDIIHPEPGGAVVVQVLLSRPHARVLHRARDSGRPGLWAGRHVPPGVLRQQPHSPGCCLSAGTINDAGWALQRQGHRHHKQYVIIFILSMKNFNVRREFLQLFALRNPRWLRSVFPVL